MTLDGFLTFLALLVALYALAPEVTRLRFRLRSGVPLVLSTIAFGLVLYFEFFDLVGRPCALKSPAACEALALGAKGGLSPIQAAFGVVLLWTGLVWASLQRTRLHPGSLPALARLVIALAEERRFSELARLVGPHLRLIEEVGQRKRGWAAFRDRLLPSQRRRMSRVIGLLREGIEPPAEGWRDRLVARLEPVSARLAGLLPRGADEQSAAQDVLRILCRRSDFIEFVALARPDFGLRMLSLSHTHVFEFSDAFFRTLINTPGSRLYEEVQANQNITSQGYVFQEHNRILHFLFGDARHAERLAVWTPVMETAIGGLHQDRTSAYVEYLSRSASRFEDAKWRDRTFVAIRFLDLMVDAALRQGVQWHMWLYYAPHLLEPLLDIYDESAPGVDPYDEHPTRASYLIYVLFDAVTDWIGAVSDLPDGSPHLNLASEQPTNENGNIPKSAILVLGDCLRMILLSDRVSDRFKRYIFEDVVLPTVRDLPVDGERSGFRRAAIASLISGGSLKKSDHHAKMREYYEAVDHLLREKLDDFGAALGSTLT